MAEQSPTSPSVQSARRPQFTLRTLLLVTAAAALLFALVAYRGFFGGLVFFLVSNLFLAAYFARRGKKGRALGVSTFALFFFAMLAPAGPSPTHYRAGHSFICTNWGLERWTYEEGRIGSESGRTTSEQFYDTDVSNWCQQHFGKCTQHKWKEGSGGSTNYTSFLGLRCATSAQSWCSVGTDVELDDAERKRLDELFVKDVKACKQEIANRLP